MPPANIQSLLWAAAGTLCFLAAGSDLFFSTHFFASLRTAGNGTALADVATGLCGGIFMLGMAWIKAGGRIFNDFQRARDSRALAYACPDNHKPARPLLPLD